MISTARTISTGAASRPDRAVAGWLQSLVTWLTAALLLITTTQPLLLAHGPGWLRYLDEAVVLAATVAWVLVRVAQGKARELFRSGGAKLLAAWMVWAAAVACVRGVPPLEGGLGIFVTVDYALAFIILLDLPFDDSRARTVCFVVVGVGLVATLAGALQHALGPGLVDGTWQHEILESELVRSPSLFRHANDFGYAMMHAAAIGVAMVVVMGGRRGWILAAISYSGLMLAISRSASMAFLVALGAAALRSRRLLMVWSLAVAMALTVFGPLFIGGLLSRVDKVHAEHGDARWANLQKALPLLAEHPLTGVGPGRFGGEVARRFASPVHEEVGITFSSSWKTVDSFWLHLTCETGAIGAALFLALLLWTLWQCWQGYLAARGERSWRAVVLLAATLALAADALAALVSNTLESNVQAATMWILAGVALSSSPERASRRLQRPIPSRQPVVDGGQSSGDDVI